MHVVILTQYYPPETGAPQNRLGYLASHLARRGHEVSVVTAMPNYPAGRVFPDWRGRLLAREDVDGVDVLRSAILASAGKGTGRQLLAYGSFALSSLLSAPLRLRRADIVLWESPPLFLAPTAWVLARRLRARLVMNVSDLWPASAVDLGMIGPGRTLRGLQRLERWAYDVSDLVLGQTDGIIEGVRSSGTGTSAALFANGVDLALWRPQSKVRDAMRLKFGLGEDDVLVGYAGNFGRAQALEQVIAAASTLAARSQVRFRIRGDGPRAGSVRRAAAGLDNVEILPPLASATLREEMQAWDVAVVPLADRPLFDGARPSKMFELMAVGVPFVFCGRGEGAAIAAASGGAVVVAPEDPSRLAEAIDRLAAEGREGRKARSDAMTSYVASHYDRFAITEQVEDRLTALVAR